MAQVVGIWIDQTGGENDRHAPTSYNGKGGIQCPPRGGSCLGHTSHNRFAGCESKKRMNQGASVVVLTCGDRILLMRRSATDPSYPLSWGFPGGRIEPNETPLEAAVRETREEAGISLRPEQLRSVGIHDENGYKIHLFTATTTNRNARLRDREHDRYAWITSREIVCYPTLPLVRKAVHYVTENNLRSNHG